MNQNLANHSLIRQRKPKVMSNASRHISSPPKRTERSFEFDSFSWWKRTGFLLVGILVAVGGFILLGNVSGHRRGRNHDQSDTVSNARQIGLALFEFESAYGQMPGPETIEKLKRETGSDLLLGTKSSNDFFRQLFAAEVVQSEQIFYAKGEGIHKPDNVFSGNKALGKGECGFTYFTGGTEISDPNRPLAAAPMIPGTNRFDPEPFDGKAVFLKADNSVQSLPIHKESGHVVIHGKNLMDPQHPVWQGKPPIIAWPDR
jgi:hypothetical protein